MSKMPAGIISALLGNHLSLVVTQFLSLGDPLVPLIGLAVLISAGIVAGWFLLGVLLNNNSIKATARGEAYQLIGTIILIAIIIVAIYSFAAVYYQAVGADPNLGTVAITSACQAELGSAQYFYLASQLLGPPTDVCAITNAPSVSPTYEIDYPLATATVLTAQLASQMAVNLNSLFEFDAWTGFLSAFKPTLAVCVQTPVSSAMVTQSPCLFPLVPVQTVNPIVYIKWSSQPYAGLEMIYKGAGTFGVLLMTALTAYSVQLVMQNIFLNIWPYLIFLGILFRATAFTRKLGGLMIALAIGAVMIYPVLFSIEYITSTSILANNPSTIQFCTGGSNAPYTYQVDFFHTPDIAQIAYACGCYPNSGDVGAQELYTIAAFNIPIVSAVNFFQSMFNGWWGGSSSSFTSNVNDDTLQNENAYIGINQQYPSWSVPCNGGGAGTALMNMLDAYGVTGVSAYFLPLINILITISAIRGLSGLLGGDTDLAGLSRLI